MARHRKSTLTQPIDVHDDDLRKERELLALPFSKSPFIDGEEAATDKSEELAVGELRAKVPNELPWSDLLLEIAMTTAFASLTDGTPILLPSNALSYICFFILVWWIWASQTAYNLRYRQADWLHRIWVFLQLVVFSSLAAFTRDFDITNGISEDSNEATTDRLLLGLGDDKSSVAAKKFRDNRLPRLNARGVSMVMAMSRLLLLVQYAIVVYHARYVRRAALWTHISALIFSTACFFAAFIVLNADASETLGIAKIVLWYFPILVEVVSHFIVNTLPGHIRYSTEGLIGRSGTVFIIILGGGLDRITTGFQDIVGNTGLGKDGTHLFLSTAVIVLVTFLLYFGSTGGSKKMGNQRGLVWFFAHIFYLAAVIITLQAVATSLSFSNLGHSLDRQAGATVSALDFVRQNPGVNVTAANLPDAQVVFPKLGISVDSYADALNEGITRAKLENNSVIVNNTILQVQLSVVDIILFEFKAEPDEGSFLWTKMQTFLSADAANSTAVNNAEFLDIFDGIIQSRGSSVLWFYGAAGSTLLGLVMLALIKGMPRDKWEWGSILSRLIAGVGVTSLSFLSIGGTKPVFDSDLNVSSKVWILALTNFLLPCFAIVLFLLLVVEYVLVYKAYRSYFKTDSIIPHALSPKRHEDNKSEKLHQSSSSVAPHSQSTLTGINT